MPTPQIDDRKAIAELANDHGWVVTEVRQHPKRSTPSRTTVQALFEIHYVMPDEEIGIIAYYNEIDKLVSAHLQYSGGQDHALRMVTLKKWFSDFGQPVNNIQFTKDHATLKRGDRLIASARRHPHGGWVVSVEGGIGYISINHMPENDQRRVLLATLKAL
jgi:hypothetical protein